MSHGHLFFCAGCDFQFLSGYHPEHSRTDAVCSACAARYVLPTRDSLAPTNDELIELHESRVETIKRRGRRKNEPIYRYVENPTGQKILMIASKSGRQYLGVEEFSCTTCRSVGTVVLELPSGAPCPKCKSGTLKDEWV